MACDRLEWDESDIRQARRFNRLLNLMPRYHTDRRLNAKVIQAALSVWDMLPHLPASGLRIEDRIAGNGERPLHLRLVIPATQPRGIYLTFHGGAWVMGAPRFDDRINCAIARECEALVASVDHHLAQDDRLDLAIADARRAAVWIATAATAEFGQLPIICGGESSGALFYGAYDMAGSPGLCRSSPRSLLIDGQSAYSNLIRLTAGLSDNEPRDPRYSPLYVDLAGLPPALCIAGELDPVFDDSMRMAERWNAANGNAEFVGAPQGVHGFNRMPLSMARKANAHARRRIRGWLG